MLFFVGEAPGALLKPSGRPFAALLEAGRVGETEVSCPRRGVIDARECEDCSLLVRQTSAASFCRGTGTAAVAQWMTPAERIVATTSATPCAAADALATRAGVHHLPVLDHERLLIGMTCRCDLEGRSERCSVADVMAHDVFATGPATTLASALAAMEQLGIGCLPVVDDTLLIGLLTRADLARAGAGARR